MKVDNSTGLQLADLLARPVGEKVADPSSQPDRWTTFRDKLCPGTETKNSPLGLKIVPWNEKYVHRPLEKLKGPHGAAPPADPSKPEPTYVSG